MSEQIEDGGPAFPIHGGCDHYGISVRDGLAALAMLGLVVARGFGDETAKRAYRIADAMLKQRLVPSDS